MLLTQKQKDWELLMQNDMQGEVVDLEPGYDQAFAEWKKEKQEFLPKWNAEKRVKEFSSYVKEKTILRKKELITKKWALPQKKKELNALAQKDQLFLVSEDKGKAFDKVMTLDEVRTKNPLDLRFLSSSLISTTLNCQDILEDQCLIQVTSNLEDSFYLVQSATIQNQTVCVSVLSPRTPDSQEVRVPLDGEAIEPFDYQFKTENGVKHVPELQLPEHAGTLKEDKSLQAPSKESISIMSVKNQGDDQNEEIRKQVLGALIAGSSATYVMSKDRQNSRMLAEAMDQARLNEQGINTMKKNPFISRQTGGALPNVSELKAKMAERAARQEKESQQTQMLQGERAKKYEMDQKKAVEKRQKAEMESKKRYEQAQTMRKKAAAFGAAAAVSGLSATLTSVPLILQLITPQ